MDTPQSSQDLLCSYPRPAGWISAATAEGTQGQRGGTGPWGLPGQSMRGVQAEAARGTHVIVSIMSRPISTQQWAWSLLGWVRPHTQ